MHTAQAAAARLDQRWAHQVACTARAGSDAAAHAAGPRPVPPPTRHPHAAPPPNTHEHAHDHQAARHAQPPVAHPIHPPKARAAAVVSSRKGVGIEHTRPSGHAARAEDAHERGHTQDTPECTPRRQPRTPHPHTQVLPLLIWEGGQPAGTPGSESHPASLSHADRSGLSA
eukprot:759642-Prymnesium_polylepis.1